MEPYTEPKSKFLPAKPAGDRLEAMAPAPEELPLPFQRAHVGLQVGGFTGASFPGTCQKRL